MCHMRLQIPTTTVALRTPRAATEDTSMSQPSTGGTAAPTPAASIRGDTGATGTSASVGAGGLVVPEGKVAVWDDTMKQMVIKDKEDVKLKTWSTRLRDAAWKFWAGGPAGA